MSSEQLKSKQQIHTQLEEKKNQCISLSYEDLNHINIPIMLANLGEQQDGLQILRANFFRLIRVS